MYIVINGNKGFLEKNTRVPKDAQYYVFADLNQLSNTVSNVPLLATFPFYMY